MDILKNAAPLSPQLTQGFAAQYESNPHLRAMANALTKNAVADVVVPHESYRNAAFKFSLNIKTLPVTNQKSSGRCWIFAALNVLREIIAKKHNMKKFELSENFAAFWDKYEKINYFLESAIDLVDADIDDRKLVWLLQTGIGDGGQWDMFVNIVEKYGIAPIDAMPETHQSSNTRQMNYLINRRMRACAAAFRKARAGGAGQAELSKMKEGMMKEFYAFLRMNFGAPPTSFDFEYVDKEGVYGVERNLTPLSFAKMYLGDTLKDYVSLIDAPTKDKPYGATYTVDYINNVVGGRDILYLNLPMAELVDLTLKQLKDGEPVWFGSDVGHFGDREKGVWDDGAYDYDGAFQMDFGMSKEDLLDYRHAAMNHAMVITGVNLDESGKPTRWKIENSWGDEKGEKGYYLMTDTWFSQYVFQSVVHKKYLNAEQRAALEKPPKRLNPWDPMGTLAD